MLTNTSYARDDPLVLKDQNFELHAWAYHGEELSQLLLHSIGWFLHCEFVPDLLLQIKRQVYVNHSRICTRYPKIENFKILVHIGEDDDQLAKNVGLYDCSDKNAKRGSQDLNLIQGENIAAHY